MGCGAAGGMLRHHMWPPSWIILTKIENSVDRKSETFCRFLSTFYPFLAQKRKTTRILLQ